MGRRLDPGVRTPPRDARERDAAALGAALHEVGEELVDHVAMRCRATFGEA